MAYKRNQPRKMTAQERDDVRLAVLTTDIKYLKDKLDSIDAKVSSGYVTIDQFEPVRKLVYGLVALILVAVVGAMIGLVLK